MKYAYSTETVNGVAGMKVPGSSSIGSGNSSSAGYPGGGSGGLHEDVLETS